MFSHLDIMWYQPVSCSNKAEPRACHNVDGEPSQSTDGNESRHDWSEHPKHAVGKGDGNGVAGEHRRRAKDGQVGDVGGDIDEGDQRERYVDGPDRCVFQYLGYKKKTKSTLVD